MGNRKKDRRRVKRATFGASPERGSKTVRLAEHPEKSNQKQPAWIFSILDLDAPWKNGGPSASDVLNDILPKIKNYESMTWAQIEQNKKNNHSVSVEDFVSAAQARIEELQLDVDELFRFRFTGTQRLWGIRDRERFKILWWDPDHKVCPSKKKHT